jgi:hypothetical protein
VFSLALALFLLTPCCSELIVGRIFKQQCLRSGMKAKDVRYTHCHKESEDDEDELLRLLHELTERLERDVIELDRFVKRTRH